MLPAIYAIISDRWDRISDGQLCQKPDGTDGSDSTQWVNFTDQCQLKDKGEVRTKVSGVLRRNRVLAANTVLYGIRHELKEGGWPVLTYQLALDYGPNDNLLRRILGAHWRLEWSDNEDMKKGIPRGWYTIIDGIPIALPSAKEVSDEVFALSPQMFELMLAKESLHEAIASFLLTKPEFSNDLPRLRQQLSLGLSPM